MNVLLLVAFLIATVGLGEWVRAVCARTAPAAARRMPREPRRAVGR